MHSGKEPTLEQLYQMEEPYRSFFGKMKLDLRMRHLSEQESIKSGASHANRDIFPSKATPEQAALAKKWGLKLYEEGTFVNRGVERIYDGRNVAFKTKEGETFLSYFPLVRAKENTIQSILNFYEKVNRNPNVKHMLLQPVGVHFVMGQPRLLFEKTLSHALLSHLKGIRPRFDAIGVFERDYLFRGPDGLLKYALPVRGLQVVEQQEQGFLFKVDPN